jgi:hypothetical protein
VAYLDLGLIYTLMIVAMIKYYNKLIEVLLALLK